MLSDRMSKWGPARTNRKHCRARKTAHSSRRLMWSLDRTVDYWLQTPLWFHVTPQPRREASVVTTSRRKGMTPSGIPDIKNSWGVHRLNIWMQRFETTIKRWECLAGFNRTLLLHYWSGLRWSKPSGITEVAVINILRSCSKTLCIANSLPARNEQWAEGCCPLGLVIGWQTMHSSSEKFQCKWLFALEPGNSLPCLQKDPASARAPRADWCRGQLAVLRKHTASNRPSRAGFVSLWTIEDIMQSCAVIWWWGTIGMWK